MAETTGIAWARSTFNPWIGCTEVSPGCAGCYARVLDARHRYGGATHWGVGVPRMRTAESTWAKVFRWNRLAALEGETGKIEDESDWHKPGFWPTFPSMCDPFDKEVPFEWRRDFIGLIDMTPNVTWLLLTKRIGNAASMLPETWKHEPPGNVWIGASVVNQQEADRDLPKLAATPAAKRFVSYEPALEKIDFSEHLERWRCRACGNAGGRNDLATYRGGLQCQRCLNRHAVVDQLEWRGIDQIIVGGESNQGKHMARPFKLEWARSTRDQCRAVGAAFFMKQTGSDHTALYERVQKNRAGADPAEWPEDLRIQEFPA